MKPVNREQLIMSERTTLILRKTIVFGGTYFLVSLFGGFLCAAFEMGAALSDSYHSGGEVVCDAFLWILQPIAAFLGWLGGRNQIIHQHVSLTTLVTVSCAWSLLLGYGLAILHSKHSKDQRQN